MDRIDVMFFSVGYMIRTDVWVVKGEFLHRWGGLIDLDGEGWVACALFAAVDGRFGAPLGGE